MKSKNTIDLKKIRNKSEKDILLHLNKKDKCIYGEIIKELRLSTSRGQEAIYSLLNKGFIKHKGNSSFIELNVELNQ